MVAGRWDLEVSARVFWMRQLGAKPTADDVAGMNPFRQPVASGPPPEKSAEAKKAESKLGWKALFQFFGQKKRG